MVSMNGGASMGRLFSEALYKMTKIRLLKKSDRKSSKVVV